MRLTQKQEIIQLCEVLDSMEEERDLQDIVNNTKCALLCELDFLESVHEKIGRDDKQDIDWVIDHTKARIRWLEKNPDWSGSSMELRVAMSGKPETLPAPPDSGEVIVPIGEMATWNDEGEDTMPPDTWPSSSS